MDKTVKYFQTEHVNRKEEKKLKIKQYKMYNHYRQNCSTTKQKFFTEPMELVSELDFEDPNNPIKKTIIENTRTNFGILDKSKKLLETFSDRNIIIYLTSSEFPECSQSTKFLKIEKKKISDELLSENKRHDLEEEKIEKAKEKNNLTIRIVEIQKEIYIKKQEMDLLENYTKYFKNEYSTVNSNRDNNENSFLDENPSPLPSPIKSPANKRVSLFSDKDQKSTNFTLYNSINLPSKNQTSSYNKQNTLNLQKAYSNIPRKNKSKLTSQNSIVNSSTEIDSKNISNMEIRSKLQKDELKRDLKVKQLKNEIKFKKDYILKLKEQSQIIDEEMEDINKEIYEIKENLNHYYHELLSRGNDTRKEGLSWILKAIWNLGYDVKMSKMPDFLDEDAIIYLLKYSNYSLQYDTLKLSCDSLRVNIAVKNKESNNFLATTNKINIEKLWTSNSLPKLGDVVNSVPLRKNAEFTKYQSSLTNFIKTNNNMSNNMGNSFYPGIVFKEPWSGTEERIEDPKIIDNYIKYFHQKLISFPKTKTTAMSSWGKKALEVSRVNLIKEILDKKTDLDSETKRNYGTLTKLQETRELIRKKMNQIKEIELDRINKEVLTNDYLRRFGVTQKRLFSAFVGEDHAISEITKLKNEYQYFIQRKKDIQTFTLGNHYSQLETI